MNLLLPINIWPLSRLLNCAPTRLLRRVGVLPLLLLLLLGGSVGLAGLLMLRVVRWVVFGCPFCGKLGVCV